eukprot:scaffold11639_cov172-Amphora_coffeaeformis.AAC.2
MHIRQIGRDRIDTPARNQDGSFSERTVPGGKHGVQSILLKKEGTCVNVRAVLLDNLEAVADRLSLSGCLLACLLACFFFCELSSLGWWGYYGAP